MTVKVDGTKGLLQNYDYLVPTTGFSYTFTAANGVILNPAATLATGTVTMPSAPVDGMTVSISTTKEITALTISGASGQTVSNAVTSLLAGGCVTYLYRAANTTWFPFSDASNTPVLDLAKSISLGWGQTWQDVTSSRATNTTYTNNTGKPIFVAIQSYSANGSNSRATVGGVVLPGSSFASTDGSPYVSFIVPNGQTYSFSAPYINYWAELR